MAGKQICSSAVVSGAFSRFADRRRIGRQGLCMILAAVALTTLIIVRAHPASACTTYISGNITVDTTWTPAGSPYCVTVDCNVQAGVTLTIEPQVLVYFYNTYSGISVSGSLNAVGTAANQIVFTSGEVTQSPGDWRGIRIFSTGSANLEYCDLSYGGHDIECGLRIESSNVQVSHCHIHDSSTDGIYITGSNGLSATIADSEIDNNAASAIRESPGVSLRYDRESTYNNLTFSSNGTDALVVTGGSFNCNRTFNGPASFNGSPVLITGGGANVLSGFTLTIQPGTTIQFTEQYANLIIEDGASLMAEGTAGQPITFTLDEATPAPGDWRGIALRPNSHVHLSYCDIGYAGRDIEAGLRIESSDVQVSHCRIHDSSTDGIYIFGSNGLTPIISDSQIDHNATRAIRENPGASLRYDRESTYSNLTFSSNGTDALVVTGGTFNCSRTFNGPAFFNGSPVLFTGGGITVNNAYTLTIEAGTTIQFAETWGTLSIFGSVVANGTQAQPIIFTTDAATPVPASWRRIYVNSAGSLDMQYCDIGYAGDSGNPCLRVESSNVQLSHCRIHDAQGYGVYIFGGSLTPTFADTQIDHVGGIAIHEDPGASGQYHAAPAYTNLTFSDNGVNALSLGGWFYCNRTFDSPGSFNGSPILLGGGGLDITGGYTLTVQPGTTLQFAETWGSLGVYGTLNAVGTATQPIAFTSDAPTLQPGSWRRIFVDSAGSAHLEYCDLGYAGDSGNPCLRTQSSNFQMRQCRIHHALGEGIYFWGSHPAQFENNVITDNASIGLHLANNSQLEALHTTIARNATGLRVESGTATLTNTIVTSHTTGVNVSGGSSATMNYTLWYDNTTPIIGAVSETGHLDAPPAFTSDGYHLSAASEAIDAGTSTTVSDDIDGDPRPIPASGAPDLGADEFRDALALIPPGSGGTLQFTNPQGRKTSIEIPPGAVSQATTILIKTVPVSFPTSGLREAGASGKKVDKKNASLPGPAPTGYYFAGHAFDLEAYQNGVLVPNFVFNVPVTVTIEYTDSDLAELFWRPKLDETTLHLFYWTGSGWAEAASGAYDRHPADNWLALPISHLTRFALFAKPHMPNIPLLLR